MHLTQQSLWYRISKDNIYSYQWYQPSNVMIRDGTDPIPTIGSADIGKIRWIGYRGSGVVRSQSDFTSETGLT